MSIEDNSIHASVQKIIKNQPVNQSEGTGLPSKYFLIETTYVFLAFLLLEWLISTCLNYQASYSFLMNIHIGIGAVLVGLAFFVATLLDKSKSGSSIKRTLLEASELYSLLIYEVFILIFLLISCLTKGSGIISIILVFFIGYKTIESIHNTIDVLAFKWKFAAKQKVIVKSIIRKFLQLEAAKRVGQNTWREEAKKITMNSSITVDYLPKDTNSSWIRTNKNGLIADVIPSKLKELVNFIKEIKAKDERNPVQLNSNQNTELTEALPLKTEKTLRLTANYYDEVTESFEFGFINQDTAVINEADQIKIKQYCEEIFVIKKEAADVFKFSHNEAYYELEDIKRRACKAIETKNTDSLKACIELYLELIESFLEFFIELDHTFTPKQPNNERIHSIHTFNWLQEAIREIIAKGLESEDIHIIQNITLFPFKICAKSIRKNDLLFLQSFVRSPLNFFEASQLHTKENIKKDLIEESYLMWSILCELATGELTDRKIKESDFKNHIAEIFRQYQELLKAAYDNNDKEVFKLFLGYFNATFAYAFSSHNGEYADISAWIETEKNKNIFILAAWIACQERDTKDDFIKELKNYLRFNLSYLINEIYLPLQLFSTDTYLKSNWRQWDHGSQESYGRITSSQVNLCEKTTAFCANIINDSTINIDLDTIKINSEPELDKLIKQITDTTVKEQLANAIKAFKVSDMEKRGAAKIVDKRIQQFMESVLSNYQQPNGISALLQREDWGNYTDKTKNKTAKNDVQRQGFVEVVNKEIFTEDRRIEMVSTDLDVWKYGAALRRSENTDIIEKLVEHFEPPVENFSNFVTRIESEHADEDTTFILCTNGSDWKLERQVNNKSDIEAKKIIQKWELSEEERKKWEDPNFYGVYKLESKSIPIYSSYDYRKQREIFVLHKNKLGKLEHYSSAEADDNPIEMIEGMRIKVVDLNQDNDRREKIIQQQNPWIQEKDDPELYLKTRAIVEISVKSSFNISDDTKGFYIQLSDESKAKDN